MNQVILKYNSKGAITSVVVTVDGLAKELVVNVAQDTAIQGVLKETRLELSE
ncbi:MAG: hypothetical protein RR324_01355 [Cellulosilyticaceae bacterium]